MARNAPRLSLPGKLVFPSTHNSGHFSMLGLGDIVMPGLLLCFVMRYDAYKRAQVFICLSKLHENWSFNFFFCISHPDLVHRKTSKGQLILKENSGVFTMRTNLLNWCNLVSISKNVVFYALFGGKNLPIFSWFCEHLLCI